MALSNAERQQRHRETRDRYVTDLLRYVTEIKTMCLEIKEEQSSLRNEVASLRNENGSYGSLRKGFPLDSLPKESPSLTSSKNHVHAVARTAVDEEFQEFWEVWPTRVGKAPARKAFARAISRASLTTILDGVRTYRRCKPTDRPWLNPATWLNQERWNDDYKNGHDTVLPFEQTTSAAERQSAIAEILQDLKDRGLTE